jgi:hypothetical protein
MKQHRTRGFFRSLEDIKRKIRDGKKLEKKHCGKIKRDWGLSVINPYKLKTMPKENEED